MAARELELPRYDYIRTGYASLRQADARIGLYIYQALGDARTVVNVGAGAGSYEPADRLVIAVEPSPVMAEQRPPDATPAVLGSAEELPFVDKSFDAAMGVLTVHHWADAARGVDEMLRVARQRVLLLTIDPDVEANLWLFDYFPGVLARDRREFPAIAQLCDWMGPASVSRVVPVPADCSDRFLLSYWSGPEGLLNKEARQATSGLARLAPGEEAAGLAQLQDDLVSGTWDARYGDLRTKPTHDVGLRLVCCDVEEPSGHE